MKDTDQPTVACPTCSGPLRPEGKEWVCVVGHRFDVAGLAAGQAGSITRSLWYSLRALEDRAIVNNFVANDYDQQGRSPEATLLRSESTEDIAVALQLRELVRKLTNASKVDEVQLDAPRGSEQSDGVGSHSPRPHPTTSG